VPLRRVLGRKSWISFARGRLDEAGNPLIL
jgi:hypothetical protein